MVTKLIAVFLMGTAVGALYRIPRNLLLYGSFTGVLVFIVAYTAVNRGSSPVLAAFLGAMTAGFVSVILARLLRKPATIFVIPGFLPLVPGREAYTAMRFMVEGHYNQGVSMIMQTVLTGGAIAFGIFLSTTIYRLLINYRLENTNYAGKG